LATPERGGLRFGPSEPGQCRNIARKSISAAGRPNSIGATAPTATSTTLPNYTSLTDVTVPRGTECLRFTPTPFHSDAMMDDLTAALKALWTRCNIARLGGMAA
jgi:hypothetical protein